MTAENKRLIDLRHLAKRFGKTKVLEDAYLQVEAGELLAIYGASGMGKTTLLNAIARIEEVEGTGTIANTPMPKVNSRAALLLRRQHIRFLQQNYALMMDKSIAANLAIGMSYTKQSRIVKQKQMQVALAQVGLAGINLHQKVHRLSGGQQQRVALARVLLKPGEIVLMDEPTGALDNVNRDMVVRLMRQLTEKGCAVIVSTHDEYFKGVVDRVVRIKNRQVVESV